MRRAELLALSKGAYTREALALAAAAFPGRAAISARRGGWEVRLAGDAGLADAFLSEALTQEYRLVAAAPNRAAAALLAAQSLLAARGGETRPAPPAEDAAFKRAAKALRGRAS